METQKRRENHWTVYWADISRDFVCIRAVNVNYYKIIPVLVLVI